MKSTKKALTLVLALSMIITMFTGPAVNSVSAATTDELVPIERVKLTFNNAGKGWSGTNSTGSQLYQRDDPDNADNKYMELSTPSSSGYNMELASDDNSTTAYEMTASTKYTMDIKFKVASATSGSDLSVCFGSQSAYDPAKAKPFMKNYTASDYNDDQWHTVTYEFTTTDTMLANSYNSNSSATNVCNRFYLVASGEGSYYIDEVTITKYGTIPETVKVIDEVKLTFNNQGKGYSGYYGTYGTQIEQVDGENSTNKYMKLYVNDGYAYNFELADGDDSTTAYKMLGSTSYSVSIKFKVISNSNNNSCINVNFGTQAPYDATLAKPYMKSFNIKDYNDGNWHTVNYEFTTTETMAANTYSNTDKTNICDRLYIVASGYCSFYVDEVTVQKITEEPTVLTKTTTLTFNNTGKGWSGTNSTGSQLYQRDDPDNANNKYMELSTPSSSGYNMELASDDNSTTAYEMTASTKYTMDIKFKVASATSGSDLSVCFGSQSAYDPAKAKPFMKTYEASDYNDGQWHTVTYEFTTTDTMLANSYNSNSSATNVCNRFYLVASGQGSYYIDEVVITKVGNYSIPDLDDSGSGGDSSGSGNTGSGDGGNTGSDEEETGSKMYTISDFNLAPHKTNSKIGNTSSSWYSSLRWYIDPNETNSAIHYKFAYDIAENAPSTSGTRGIDAKGTNGDTNAQFTLVYEDNTPIEVVQGKSYRISLKYKIISVENNSFISFSVLRGKLSNGWTGSYGVSSVASKDDSRYIIDTDITPTDDWVNVSLTFTADYTDKTDFNALQIGGAGYGEAIIDDIVFEEIDASEVSPPNTDSSKFGISSENGIIAFSEYKLTDPDLTIPAIISGKRIAAIGKYALLYNRYVKNVTIENGPTVISDYAFEYAKVLETVTLPASITTINKGSFYGIKTLTSITVDEANANFASVDGVLYTKDMTELILYPASKEGASFTVPATVTKIHESAFKNAVNLETITIAGNVEVIENRAFMNCTKLASINIPESVTSLGASAFRGCSSLTSNGITISDSIIAKENAFADCDNLVITGNITGDSTVDIADATTLIRHLAGHKDAKLGILENIAADINNDGTVDLLDAVILKRHLANWKNYDKLPFDGKTINTTYNDYTSSGTTPELVINLKENNTQTITSKRDINYDPNKEDVIIILATGQSNGTTTVGYSQEYGWYVTQGKGTVDNISAETTRPEPGTVFSGSSVTSLSSSYDVYNLANPERNASCMGGYTPALGKALHEATGAKIVFVQASQGAVGVHEWTPDPENWKCTCPNNGGGKLYKNAIANFTKTYQALKEDYNIIATTYIYLQGEHEQSRYANAETGATVHDTATYEQAYMAMHNGFMEECEIDMGGVILPRAYHAYFTPNTNNVQNGRRPTYARLAQIAAANNTDNLFLLSNFTDLMMTEGTPYRTDPSNSIHYSQIVYNEIGNETADSILKYLGLKPATEFTGFTVYNNVGAEVCKFDANGNVTSGNNTLAFSDDNSQLYIKFNTGTMYNYDLTSAGTDTEFVNRYGMITTVTGEENFKIVVNPNVK